MSLSDHDRPLNERGIASSLALGDWLREKDYLPDEALVSSAKRTQETFAGLKLDIQPTILSGLYHTSSDQLIESISNATDDTVLVIAHNPGIGDLALRLARMIRQHPNHSRFADYPTGATLIIQWDADSWQDIDWSQGTLKEFVIPREIIE